MKRKAYFITEKTQNQLDNLIQDINSEWTLDNSDFPPVIATDNFVIYHLVKYEKGDIVEAEPEPEPETPKTYEDFRPYESLIESVKSVPIDKVDEYIQEGYRVERIYSKHAILIKSKLPKMVPERV